VLNRPARPSILLLEPLFVLEQLWPLHKDIMVVLEGNALLYTVSLLACLGFLLIGFDNGLMGGLVNGRHRSPVKAGLVLMKIEHLR